MRGSNYGDYDDEIRERAYALLMSGKNPSQVAHELNVPRSTIKSWEAIAEKSGRKLVEFREQKKAEFVESAWRVIDLAKSLLEKRLKLALEQGESLNKLMSEISKAEGLTETQKKEMKAKLSALKIEDVGKLSIVLGTLYDKQALAQGDATAVQDVNIVVQIDDD